MTNITKELAGLSRELLGISEGDDQVAEDRALYKTLASVGLAEHESDAAKTHALFQVYKAHDDLTCIRQETKFPGALERMGYTPEIQRTRLMETATKLTKALEDDHGQTVMADIAAEIERIEHLEDAATMTPSIVEKVAKAADMNLPAGVSRFLNTRARPGEAVGRLREAIGLTETAQTQMTGLLQRGEDMLRAEGWKPSPYYSVMDTDPVTEAPGAHA